MNTTRANTPITNCGEYEGLSRYTGVLLKLDNKVSGDEHPFGQTNKRMQVLLVTVMSNFF